jgi:hypothetical protein
MSSLIQALSRTEHAVSKGITIAVYQFFPLTDPLFLFFTRQPNGCLKTAGIKNKAVRLK